MLQRMSCYLSHDLFYLYLICLPTTNIWNICMNLASQFTNVYWDRKSFEKPKIFNKYSNFKYYRNSLKNYTFTSQSTFPKRKPKEFSLGKINCGMFSPSLYLELLYKNSLDAKDSSTLRPGCWVPNNIINNITNPK